MNSLNGTISSDALDRRFSAEVIFWTLLNLNDEKKKEDKLKWHRTPARIPIMLYLDDHTLYSIGNDDCYPITIEVKDEQETPIALYTIPDNKTEPIVLPESWNGRFKILVSYCERIYEGHIDLTR